METPDTFAQAAKLQRKALMREKHARELGDLRVLAPAPHTLQMLCLIPKRFLGSVS